MENKGIIYKVTNQINGKIYIGLTHRNLHIRKLNHQSAAFTQSNNNNIFQRYPLPKKGKYMVLCFIADNGAFFTTIRSCYPAIKKTYYELLIF